MFMCSDKMGDPSGVIYSCIYYRIKLFMIMNQLCVSGGTGAESNCL